VITVFFDGSGDTLNDRGKKCIADNLMGTLAENERDGSSAAAGKALRRCIGHIA
jgi:hypothetical protein